MAKGCGGPSCQATSIGVPPSLAHQHLCLDVTEALLLQVRGWRLASGPWRATDLSTYMGRYPTGFLVQARGWRLAGGRWRVTDLCTYFGLIPYRVFGAGARLAFGGRPLEGHAIPACYGAMEPTAVFVPLAQLLSPEHFLVATTELFGPFQVKSREGCQLGRCSTYG